MKDQIIHTPEQGYDLIADSYNSSKWHSFWEANEKPILNTWIKSLAKDSNGLDAGTGTGDNLKYLNNWGREIYAIDISFNMLFNCKNRFQNLNNNIHFQKGNIVRTGLVSSSIDWIVCTRVLSHIKSLPQAFKEFNRILTPRGNLFISDIHPNHRYKATAFYNNTDKVYIETIKHRVPNILKTAKSFGFTVINFDEYYIDDLYSKPDEKQFFDLYINNNKPIFYTLELLKI